MKNVRFAIGSPIAIQGNERRACSALVFLAVVVGVALSSGGCKKSDPQSATPVTTIDLTSIEQARAGQPTASTRAVVAALERELSLHDLQYLALMRWEKIPNDAPERLLADPIVRRSLVIAIRARRTLESTSSRALSSCSSVPAAIISIKKQAVQFVKQCVTAGIVNCAGAYFDILGSQIENSVGNNTPPEDAVSTCSPPESDPIDPGVDDCTHGDVCDPNDLPSDDDLGATGSCSKLLPTACGTTCCSFLTNCCDGMCKFGKCDAPCSGCHCPDDPCVTGTQCCSDGTCRQSCSDRCGGCVSGDCCDDGSCRVSCDDLPSSSCGSTTCALGETCCSDEVCRTDCNEPTCGGTTCGTGETCCPDETCKTDCDPPTCGSTTCGSGETCCPDETCKTDCNPPTCGSTACSSGETCCPDETCKADCDGDSPDDDDHEVTACIYDSECQSDGFCPYSNGQPKYGCCRLLGSSGDYMFCPVGHIRICFFERCYCLCSVGDCEGKCIQ